MERKRRKCRMKVKQIAAILMSSVLVTGLLAGCGSSGSGGDGSSKEGAAGGSGKIELEFFTQKREAADTFDGYGRFYPETAASSGRSI